MNRKRNRYSTSLHRNKKTRKWWWISGFFVLLVYVLAMYIFFVLPTGFRWRALYSDPIYPDGYEVRGIDISHHQGQINWEKLRTAKIKDCPIRFCIVKATEGQNLIDPYFANNFYQVREHGLVRGAYHFWNPSATAHSQAHNFINNVELEYGDLPPVLDVEKKKAKQTTKEFQQEILIWLHIIEEKYNVRPIIYTGYKFKMAYLNTPDFDSYPYWIAHYYVDSVAYKGQWKFWQHTDNGHLPGIKGPVDLNIYNGSSYDLQMLTIH